MGSGCREVLIVAGEASAERYGARLVERLRERCGAGQLRFFGTGGDEMAEAGVRLLGHVRELGSIGPREALSHLLKYREVYRRILRECAQRRPAVAVLIDFPEFNLRLARRLKRAGIKVVYYVSPQLWAWRRGRVRIVRRSVDRMAVILPFEEEFYRRRGVAAEFVGHPILEDFAPDRNRDRFLQSLGFDPLRPTLAVLAGSRRREVEYILPVLLRASLLVLGRMPAQFLVSVAPTIEERRIHAIMEEIVGRDQRRFFRTAAVPARDVLACCDFAFVKSGTSTLEAALAGTPFLIAYRISPASWLAGRILVRSRWKGLVNLVAGEEIVPEFFQGRAAPQVLASVALRYLESPEEMQAMRTRLARVRELLGARRASESVAAMVAQYL